jgi:hypothetical protein
MSLLPVSLRRLGRGTELCHRITECLIEVRHIEESVRDGHPRRAELNPRRRGRDGRGARAGAHLKLCCGELCDWKVAREKERADE